MGRKQQFARATGYPGSFDRGTVLMAAAVLYAHLAVLWLLWSGYLEPTMLAYGALSCGVALYAALRLKLVDRDSLPVYMYPRMFPYLWWLLREIVKSNIQVARIILRRKISIRRQILRVPSSQKSDVGQVIFANSITLTPGTISLELRDGEILVHALNRDFGADLETGEMNARVCHLEGGG